MAASAWADSSDPCWCDIRETEGNLAKHGEQLYGVGYDVIGIRFPQGIYVEDWSQCVSPGVVGLAQFLNDGQDTWGFCIGGVCRLGLLAEGPRTTEIHCQIGRTDYYPDGSSEYTVLGTHSRTIGFTVDHTPPRVVAVNAVPVQLASGLGTTDCSVLVPASALSSAAMMISMSDDILIGTVAIQGGLGNLFSTSTFIGQSQRDLDIPIPMEYLSGNVTFYIFATDIAGNEIEYSSTPAKLYGVTYNPSDWSWPYVECPPDATYLTPACPIWGKGVRTDPRLAMSFHVVRAPRIWSLAVSSITLAISGLVEHDAPITGMHIRIRDRSNGSVIIDSDLPPSDAWTYTGLDGVDLPPYSAYIVSVSATDTLGQTGVSEDWVFYYEPPVIADAGTCHNVNDNPAVKFSPADVGKAFETTYAQEVIFKLCATVEPHIDINSIVFESPQPQNAFIIVDANGNPTNMGTTDPACPGPRKLAVRVKSNDRVCLESGIVQAKNKIKGCLLGSIAGKVLVPKFETASIGVTDRNIGWNDPGQCKTDLGLFRPCRIDRYSITFDGPQGMDLGSLVLSEVISGQFPYYTPDGRRAEYCPSKKSKMPSKPFLSGQNTASDILGYSGLDEGMQDCGERLTQILWIGKEEEKGCRFPRDPRKRINLSIYLDKTANPNTNEKIGQLKTERSDCGEGDCPPGL